MAKNKKPAESLPVGEGDGKIKNIDISKKLTREIDFKTAEMADLLAWYNENSGGKALLKFRDRTTAEAKCADLKEAVLALAGGVSKPSAGKAATKAAGKAPGSGESTGDRGRKSSHAGKRIFPLKDENPRRAGTHGHTAYQVLLDDKKAKKGNYKGTPYDEYIKGGGAGNHLAWDLDKGNVKVE